MGYVDTESGAGNVSTVDLIFAVTSFLLAGIAYTQTFIFSGGLPSSRWTVGALSRAPLSSLVSVHRDSFKKKDNRTTR